jgi:nicotinate phosphoribosyltransferase
MAYAEWKAGRHNEHCIFEMFFRKCPFNGKYAIFTGHDEVFEFLKTYKFTKDHLTYLKKVTMPHAEQEFFDYLEKLNCDTIKVYGATDGEIVFPD